MSELKSPTPLHDVGGRKRRAALISVVANFSLAGAKATIGIMTGSVSVLSEGLHSATDLIGSLVAFFSVRISDAPPDEEHPYGHGKVEYLSGLFEGLLIFVAACVIIFQAIARLARPSHEIPELRLALWVMGVAAVISFILSVYLKRVAKKTDSLALEAEANHVRTDVYTSLGVFLGLLLAKWTRLPWLDPVAGILVSILILSSSLKMLQRSYRDLIDERLPIEEVSSIGKILDQDPRVLGYHKLRTRKSGAFRHADVHVLMEDSLPLVEAHEIAENLEDKIREALPEVWINIHIEPYRAEIQHQMEAHGLKVEDLDPKLTSNLKKNALIATDKN